jgi:hypothetical protein
MKRSQVADLHQALTLIGLQIDNVETDNQRFGKSTLKGVSRFQEEHQLPVTGVVDEVTAQALNGLLAERGMLDEELIYLVRGVVHRADGKPAMSLKVQAFDRDVSGEQLLGSTVTDQEGAYRINFSAGQFKRTDAERGGPEIFIRVSGMAGEPLGQSKIVNDAPPELNLDLALPAVLIKKFAVRGNVAASDGQSIDNIIVKAFDRNVGADDKLLGQATANGQGNYSIFYTLDELGGKSAADMVIVLYRDENLLQNSDVIFNAGPEIIKDFIVPVNTTPEFQRLSDKIKPLLGDRVQLGGLEKEQADFLSKKIGVGVQRIEWLAQSHRLAGANETLAAFYYALFSQGLPSDPHALLNMGRDPICRALQRATTFNLIPALDTQTLDRIFNQELPGQNAENLLKSVPPQQRASLGDILMTIPQALPDGCPEKVANVIGGAKIDYNKFQEQLETSGLTTKQAVSVERVLRLGDLTRGNIPLVQHLQEVWENEQDASLLSLAGLRRDQWIDKAYTYGLPAGSGLSPGEYANQLERAIEELHPTAVLAARVESGDLVISRPGFEKVGAFLTNNPDFDILNTNISSFLEKANFNGVENKKRLSQSLLKLQRVKKLSATWDEAGALLNNGLDSALQVVEIGEQRLQQRLAGDVAPERAAIIYQNAKKTNDFGLALMARIMPRFSPAPAAAMGMATRLNETTLKDILKDFPSLQELFGSLDYCEYAPHLTVLSPAAYLVDLLQFLGSAGESQATALNALLERRPDLVDMEFSAGNTNTELPYIDLVLEILENAVALPLTVPLPDLVSGEAALNTNPLPSSITNALQKTSLENIGGNLKAQKVLEQFSFDDGDAWTVKEQQRNWTLYNQPGDIIYVSLSSPSWKIKITLPKSDLESLIGELNQGRLSPQIKEPFERFLQKIRGKRYLNISGCSTTSSSVAAGKLTEMRWKVNCCLGVNITVQTAGGHRSLTLKTPDGREIFNETYSASTIQATVSSLKQGVFGPLIAHFLDFDNYTIIPGPEENSWMIEGRLEDITLSIIEPDQLTITALTYQTTGDSEELKASPGNQNPYAYEKLRQVNFPWSLPFNLPLETVRAFLERAGVSRRQLIQISKPESYLDDLCWVYEVLGISSEEAYQIANPPTESRILWNCWGLSPDENGQVRIYDAAAGENVPSDNNPSGNPFQVLSRVSILMQQARISYDDLLKVLQTRCISRNKGINFTMDNPAESHPNKMNIQQIRQADGEVILDRMHRFIRLWRKTGWEINELDMAVFVFQTHRGLQGKRQFPVIDCDILKQLAHIKQLQEILDLPVNTLASWWSGRRRGSDHRWWSGHRAFFYSPNRTFGRPEPTTLYERLFLKPFAGDHPADPDFAINGSKTDLLNPIEAKKKSLSEKAVRISAALGIAQEDFSGLLSLMTQPNSALPNETTDLLRLLHSAQNTDRLTNTLTHYNLFMLYRIVGLAKALHISFADFFRLELLMNCSPFDNTAAAVEFCETVKLIRNSGFTIEELSYLLLHESSPGSPFEIYDDQIAQILSAIRQAMQNKLNALEQQVRDLVRNNSGGPVVLKSLTGRAAMGADAAALSISFVPSDDENSITSNLTLPGRGINGSTITWSSSDETIISIGQNSNTPLFFTGTVHRGDSTRGDRNIILTASVAINGGSDPVIKDFKVTVPKPLPGGQEAVNAAAALLKIGYASGDGPSSVTGNLSLPIHGIHNTSILWISSSGNVTRKKDLQHYSIWEVSRPKITGDDLAITLEAIISVSDGASVTRKFNITVPKQLSGEQAVIADAAALTIGYATGDSPYGVIQDLILVSQGSNGSSITWSSSDPAVLGNDGTIKTRPPETGDNICVAMTATITNADDESIKVTKIFYSPVLLDKALFDENRLANILSDSLIHEQLVDAGLGMAANLFGLELPVARRLLVSRSAENALLSFTDSAGKTKDGIEAFLEPRLSSSSLKKAPDSLTFPAVFHLSHRLHKVAAILAHLSVKPAQINWFADSAGMPVLKFNKLPIAQQAADGAELFQAWRRSVILFKIRNSIPKMDALLDKYIKAIAAKDMPQAMKVIADGLKLPVEMLRIAVAKLDMADLAQYQDPCRLEELIGLLSAMKKLGVDTKPVARAEKTQIETLADDSVSLDDKAEVLVRSLLRAKYDSDSWRDIIKPIADKLRILRRDALVDYLIHREELRDANDLYEYYLIDPQMSPLMMTSRLVQATAAVQLFVQQCLLNLVDGVALNEDERKRWEWMKNYRVWEANRKVFLYPENWLYPELRDDKTQIFKQLESGLAQGEPNYKLAKANLLLYMDEIAEIAKIKVYGMYYAGDGTLYAVGRTPNQPYHYYWRKCEDFGGVRMHWYGWERIDMDINDDHVMPFVLEGNLYIAWPTITTKSNSNNAKQEWEIKLNWACYTGKGWSQKKVTRNGDSIIIPGVNADFNVLNYITFRLYYPNPNSYQILDFPVYLASNIAADVPITPPFSSDSSGTRSGGSKGVIDVQVIERIQGTSKYYYAKGYKVSITMFRWVWQQNPGGQIANDGYNGEWTLRTSDNSGQLLTKEDGTCSYTTVQSFAKVEIYIESPDGTWRTDLCYPYDAEDPDLPYNSFTAEGTVCQYQAFVPNAYFNVIADAPPHQEAAVHMDIKGKFRLNALTDIVKLDDKTGPTLPVLGNVAEFYGNGYNTPVSGGRRFELTINQQILSEELKVDGKPLPKLETQNSGEFFIVEAAKAKQIEPNTGLGYYEDIMKKIYIKGVNDGSASWYGILDNIMVTAGLRLPAYSKFEGSNDGFYSLKSQSCQDDKQLNETIIMVSDSSKSFVEKSIGFNLRGPSALYNWEIFYHAPLLVAEFLTKQQRFEEAQRWLHYIFNPTAAKILTNGAPGDSVSTYWQFLPFRETGNNLQDLFAALGKLATNQTSGQSAIKDFYAEISNWLSSPFSPFAVARARWTAFQWRVVFAYLDNLIAWGDQMFRRFTRESMNEAIQYYVLAARLLGPRPRTIQPPKEDPALTYRDIFGKWAGFWSDWYNITNNLPPTETPPQPANDGGQTEALISLGMSCFSIPHNDKLTTYWDTVEERLFKIRNCMDIDGVTRELPLFTPPIDPMLLVRATAAGLDIETVLADMDAALLPYRFNIIVQKANEICAEVKSLGSALLAALEKKDAEGLALLRSGQEVALLNRVTQVKQRQVEEADANIDNLNQSKAVAMARFTQYQKLLGKAVSVDSGGLPVLSAGSSLQVAATAAGEETGLGLIQYEVDQLSSLDKANNHMESAGIANTVSSILHALPNISVGTAVVSQIGGSNLGSAAGAVAAYFNMLAGNANHESNKKSLFASYQRRQDDWVYQSKLALEEMKQLNQQIIAAQIRLEMAQIELDNHLKQIINAQAVDDFMHQKYTNQELYSWMSGQISNVYFNCYQLAHDLAKRAERAFRNELVLSESNFIQFGYWDSLKKGLMAGENLSFDLKRMEVAYLEQNRRELEITKHVSLSLLNPLRLLDLKENGECRVDLAETLFDLDYPGHYLRRIKSVSLTIPCVTGPYTNINCKLTLLKHSVRTKAGLLNNHYGRADQNDPRFTDGPGMAQSIVTSNGQNDSGLFEVNFHDERYLPFEGAGVISTWRLEMPRECNAFDFNTISDIILHLKYTAREGGEMLRKAALEAATPDSGICLISACHDFSSEWHRFLNPGGNMPPKFGFTLGPGHFPFILRGKTLEINKIDVLVKPLEENDLSQINDLALTLSLTENGTTKTFQPPSNLVDSPNYRGMLYGTFETSNGTAPLGQFVLGNTSRLPQWTLETGTKADVKDLVIICSYTVSKT